MNSEMVLSFLPDLDQEVGKGDEEVEVVSEEEDLIVEVGKK